MKASIVWPLFCVFLRCNSSSDVHCLKHLQEALVTQHNQRAITRLLPIARSSTQPPFTSESDPPSPPLYATNQFVESYPIPEEDDPMLMHSNVTVFDCIYRACRRSNRQPFSVRDEDGFEYHFDRGLQSANGMIGTVWSRTHGQQQFSLVGDIYGLLRMPKSDGSAKSITVNTVKGAVSWTSNTFLRILPSTQFKRIRFALNRNPKIGYRQKFCVTQFMIHRVRVWDTAQKQHKPMSMKVTVTKTPVNDGQTMISGLVSVLREWRADEKVVGQVEGIETSTRQEDGRDEIIITMSTSKGIQNICLNPSIILARHDGIRLINY